MLRANCSRESRMRHMNDGLEYRVKMEPFLEHIAHVQYDNTFNCLPFTYQCTAAVAQCV